MNHKYKDAKRVKGRKARTIPNESGAVARSAKEPDEGRDSRVQLVLAPSLTEGKALIEMLNWKAGKVAVVTEPSHLEGAAIYPGEDIYGVVGIDNRFLKVLESCAMMFCPGESYNLKMYVL